MFLSMNAVTHYIYVISRQYCVCFNCIT